MNVTQRLINECRDLCFDLKMRAAQNQIALLNLMMQEPGCDYFSLSGERDFWRIQMEALITKRSPAQIARMEAKLKS